MKFYDEEQMRDLRETLEKSVLKWPGVLPKEMMGCLCYFRGKKFFAFLVTKGIVVTKLTEDERSKLSERPGSKPFEMAGRTSSKWIQVQLRGSQDLQEVLPFVKKSYEAAAP